MTDDRKTRVLITLTDEEYEILREYSQLEGTPMAAVLVQVLRSGKTFQVLEKAIHAATKLKSIKQSIFGSLSKKSVS
jgi:hypothetical protein